MKMTIEIETKDGTLPKENSRENPQPMMIWGISSSTHDHVFYVSFVSMFYLRAYLCYGILKGDLRDYTKLVLKIS
jgi:hypothetical protein